jgi:CRP-like cAMP-binding protein
MSVISIRGVPTFQDDAGGGPEVGAGDLADILLTAPLPLPARAELAACLDVEHVGPGHRLARSGGGGYALVLLRSGTAGVRRDGVLERRVGPGDWFGGLGGDSGPDRPGADLTTESVTTAYVMDASSLRGLMRRSPDVVALLRERIRALTAVSW